MAVRSPLFVVPEETTVEGPESGEQGPEAEGRGTEAEPAEARRAKDKASQEEASPSPAAGPPGEEPTTVEDKASQEEARPSPRPQEADKPMMSQRVAMKWEGIIRHGLVTNHGIRLPDKTFNLVERVEIIESCDYSSSDDV